MVARVALISSRDAERSGIAPVSGLEFHADAEGSNGDTSEIFSSVNRVYMIGGGNVESEHREEAHLDAEKGKVS